MFEPSTKTYGVLDIRDPHESAVVVGGVVDVAGAGIKSMVGVYRFLCYAKYVFLFI